MVLVTCLRLSLSATTRFVSSHERQVRRFVQRDKTRVDGEQFSGRQVHGQLVDPGRRRLIHGHLGLAAVLNENAMGCLDGENRQLTSQLCRPRRSRRVNRPNSSGLNTAFGLLAKAVKFRSVSDFNMGRLGRLCSSIVLVIASLHLRAGRAQASYYLIHYLFCRFIT